MTWTSKTFRVVGEASQEMKERLARIVERHRPAMNKVIEDARKLAQELKDKIKNVA